MHKYSYELSASYRHEAKLPRQYYLPQRIPSPAPLYPTPIRQHPTTPSPVFIRSHNHTTSINKQPPTTRPPNHNHLGRSCSGLKMNQTLNNPSPWEHPIPAKRDEIQNRLKILSHLGERHEQAIRDIDCCKTDNNQSPIRAIYQDSTLKRQFSFNRIPEAPIGPVGPQQREANERMGQGQGGIRREYALLSKDSKLNGVGIIYHPRQKTKLRLDIQEGTSKGSTWRDQNRFDIQMDKPTRPNDTVAKLSSLQQRIRTTVQPYIQR